jgi:hypothetical protein
MVPDYSLTIEESYGSGQVVVLLGWAQGTFIQDGQLPAWNHWQTPAVARALVEGNQVAEWRIYADNEPIRMVMAAGQEKRS